MASKTRKCVDRARFGVTLPGALERQLAETALARHKSRNAMIVEAVRLLIDTDTSKQEASERLVS